MSEKILVPMLGESITEATVSKWLKKKGDQVKADEAIVELETDKVNLEVPSPVSGVMEEINAKDGEVVEVGALLASVNEGNNFSEDTKVEKITPEKIKSNIVNLDADKNKNSIKVFNENNSSDEPLILTNEIKKKNR